MISLNNNFWRGRGNPLQIFVTMSVEKKKTSEPDYKALKGKSFGERLRMSTLGQRVRFSIAVLLIIGFLIWAGAWWLLLLLPLAVDVYLTKYVNWEGWKESKNPVLHSIAEWVDAIVFALVAVYVFGY